MSITAINTNKSNKKRNSPIPAVSLILISLLVLVVFLDGDVAPDDHVASDQESVGQDALTPSANEASQAPDQIGPNDKFVPGQVLIRFVDSLDVVRQEDVLRSINAESVRPLRGLSHTLLVKVSRSTDIVKLVADLGNVGGVAEAEPNFVIRPEAIPNDPDFDKNWPLLATGLYNSHIGYDLGAVDAWDSETGSPNVVIGMIDTGMDYQHVELVDNAWTNSAEVPGNGIDDDNNGWVDDVYGIDTYDNDSDPSDELGHGTHVAGIIAARGNNGVGGTGVMWQASLLPCKFTDSLGRGTLQSALECFSYFIELKDSGVDIFVANVSWGSPFSNMLSDAITEFEVRGIGLVASAGNLGTDTDTLPHYPSSYTHSNIISVASIDGQGRLSGFSGFGVASVDIAAPGELIYGPYPGNAWIFGDGTSLAGAHVSGVFGLLKSHDPNISIEEARDWVLSHGKPLAGLEGKVATGALVRADLPVVDLDADGMSDRWEIDNGFDPTDPGDASGDADGDGLSNLEEYIANSNPRAVDTDSDGINDADEVNNYQTDPASADSDGDGLSDQDEIFTFLTNPLDADSDGDGLGDADEVTTHGTDPLAVDSDNDGLSDSWEVEFGFNPLVDDSRADDDDGDGLSNAEEFSAGTHPRLPDTDGDSLTDGDEVNLYNTNPTSTDTDGDGMGDGWEVRYSLNPLSAGDRNSDGDSDGFSNFVEHNWGTDPTNSLSIPPTQPWVTEQGNPQHTAHVALLSDAANFEVRWQKDILTGIGQSMIISDRRLALRARTTEGEPLLEMVDPKNGNTTWRRTFSDETLVGNVSLLGGRIVFGALFERDLSRYILSVDPVTGNPVQSAAIALAAETDTMALFGDDIFFREDGDLIRLNPASGSVLWRSPLFGDGFSVDYAAMAANQSYVVLYARQTLYVYDRQTGNLEWQQTDGSCSISSPIAVTIDDQDAAFVTHGDCITRFDLANRTVDWQVVRQITALAPSLGNGVLFVGTAGGLEALDTNSGASLWLWNGENVSGGNIVSTTNHVFFAAGGGTRAIEIASQNIVWQTDNFGLLAISDEGSLLIAGSPGRLTSVNIDGDTDGDGLPNWWEQTHGLDYLDPSDATTDPDADGLDNRAEYANFTDPQNSDSDDDGLSDGEEVTTYGTIPAIADTDGDGLSDGDEVLVWGVDPLNTDSDGDEISDGDEVSLYGTDPADPISKPDFIVSYSESFETGIPSDWITPEGVAQPWSSTPNDASDGSLSIKSGPLTRFQESAIEWTQLFVAGELSFDARINVGAAGSLYVYIDGILFGIYTNVDWQRHTIPLSQGRHVIRFAFEKGPDDGSPSDAVWIDNVAFSVPLPFAYDDRNFLVVTDNKLWELTPDLQQARNPIAIPGTSNTLRARDLVVTQNHDIAIIAAPRLYLFTPSRNEFTYIEVPGWVKCCNILQSGIAAWDDGIVAIDNNVSNPSLLRFSDDGQYLGKELAGTTYFDIEVANDGFLYALRSAGGIIDRIDLPGFTVVNSIAVASDTNDIAIDASGNIFTASLGGQVRKYDNAGTLLETMSVSMGGAPMDIEVGESGTVAVGGRGGVVGLSDSNLTAVTVVDLHSNVFGDSTHVANVTRNGKDRDSDGLPDWWETIEGLNADDPSDAMLDSDADGLTNLQEFQNFTKPLVGDTDNDGVTDGDEVFTYFTNPVRADSDGDGLSDSEEIFVSFTDPNDIDSDDDSLSDFDELNVFGTNPLSSDSDSDGAADGWEIDNSLDPLDAADGALDGDMDGLSNVEEFQAGTNIGVADTDRDGLTDGDEVLTFTTSPIDDDTDNDQMLDGWEVQNSLDPLSAGDALLDLDGDSFSNFLEYFASTDPALALSVPSPGQWVTHQKNARHDGYVPIRLRPTSFHERWSFHVHPATSKRLHQVVALNGRVFVAADATRVGQHVVALDEFTGAEIWRHDVGDVFKLSPPAYETGRIYVQSGDYIDSAMLSLNENTGVTEFSTSFSAQAPDFLALAPFEGDLFGYAGAFGGIASFSASMPVINWSVSQQDRWQWSPAVDQTSIYYHGNSGLIVLDRLNGAEQFTINDANSQLTSSANGGGPVIDNRGNVIVRQGDRLVYFDTWAKTIKWQASGILSDAQPAFANGIIYTVSGDSLKAFDVRSGAELWSWTSPGVTLKYAPLATINHVLVSSLTTTFAIEIATGNSVWSFPKGGPLAMSDDSTLYISGVDGVLTAIDILGDVDEDGISDDWEIRYGLDPSDQSDAQLDFDGDGLINLEEFRNGTDPLVTDTDSDGISDGDEVLIYNTNPLNADTDNDGLFDNDEITVWQTNPNISDSDGDGLDDREEVETYNTNPLISDSDNDGFTDLEEVLTGYDPVDAQSVPTPMATNVQSFESGALTLGWRQVANDDGDWSVISGGASDGTYRLQSGAITDSESAWIEYTAYFANGTIAFDARVDAPLCCDRLYVHLDGQFQFYVLAGDWRTNSLNVTEGIHTISFEYRKDHRTEVMADSASIDLFRFTADNDLDGMSNEWEVSYGLNPDDPADAAADPDTDGLDNLGEYAAGTSPLNPDTDADTMPDGWEVSNLLNPLVDDAQLDADNDGLENGAEYVAGTDPNIGDSDNDGMPDGWEVDYNLDPLSNDSQQDADADGLSNGTEFTLGTFPNDDDSDDDQMPDGWEVNNNLDPLVNDASADPDGDGVSNLAEYQAGTDPNVAPPPPPPPPPPPSSGGGGGGSVDLPSAIVLLGLLVWLHLYSAGTLLSARPASVRRRARRSPL